MFKTLNQVWAARVRASFTRWGQARAARGRERNVSEQIEAEQVRQAIAALSPASVDYRRLVEQREGMASKLAQIEERLEVVRAELRRKDVAVALSKAPLDCRLEEAEITQRERQIRITQAGVETLDEQIAAAKRSNEELVRDLELKWRAFGAEHGTVVAARYLEAAAVIKELYCEYLAWAAHFCGPRGGRAVPLPPHMLCLPNLQHFEWAAHSEALGQVRQWPEQAQATHTQLSAIVADIDTAEAATAEMLGTSAHELRTKARQEKTA